MKTNFILPFPGSHFGTPTIDFEKPQSLSGTILESATTSHAYLVPNRRYFLDVFIPFLSLLWPISYTLKSFP